MNLNLSNHQLSCHEIQVLSKGLNFVPTPKILKEDIANSTQQMCRKIKLQEYFRYLPRFEKLPFTGKSIFSVEDDKVDPTTVEFNNKTRIGVFAQGQILCISPNGLQAGHCDAPPPPNRISDQYSIFDFVHKMAAGDHFG